MKYVVLVSHGTFAYGLHDALKMLAGEAREDILSFGLENGTGVDALAERMKERLGQLQEEDEVVLLGDLVGGSPLTTAANVAAGLQLLDRTVIIGGMNLPLALSAVLMKDAMELTELSEMLIPEAREELKAFQVEQEQQEDEI